MRHLLAINANSRHLFNSESLLLKFQVTPPLCGVFLLLSRCWTAVFGLVSHIHIWFAMFTFGLPYSHLTTTSAQHSPYRMIVPPLSTPMHCTQPGDRFSRSPFQQMYVRALQNVVCRDRMCNCSFAYA